MRSHQKMHEVVKIEKHEERKRQMSIYQKIVYDETIGTEKQDRRKHQMFYILVFVIF